MVHRAHWNVAFFVAVLIVQHFGVQMEIVVGQPRWQWHFWTKEKKKIEN